MHGIRLVITAAAVLGLWYGGGLGVSDLWADPGRVEANEAPSGSGPSAELVPVDEVRVQLTDRGPVVLLIVKARAVPIFVDMTVAGSIQGALTGEKFPRPMSHDLMHTIMATYGARVTQTVITLKGGTFYGALSVWFDGRETVFDSRSSDSIALAVHFHAPILVPREVVESAGVSSNPSGEKEL